MFFVSISLTVRCSGGSGVVGWNKKRRESGVTEEKMLFVMRYFEKFSYLCMTILINSFENGR